MTSRLERYADSRADEVVSIVADMQEQTDALSDEERAEADGEATETDAMTSVISQTVEDAMILGYFLGMLDGRRDANGSSGERFVNGGKQIADMIDRTTSIHCASKARTATERYIQEQVPDLLMMPVGVSFDKLREIESEVR